MNRLIKLLGSCDLSDVTSLRKLSANEQGNVYMFENTRIICEETHRSTPEIVRFIIAIPLNELAVPLEQESDSIAIADYGLRLFCHHLQAIEFEKLHSTGKEKFTGKIEYHQPNATVLLRNSAYVMEGNLHLTVKIRFPVHMMEKRNVVAGKLSVRLVRKELARAIRNTINEFSLDDCTQRIILYRRQGEIRKILSEQAYVAFIANGSILPRKELSDLPLEHAVPFQSPPEDEVTLLLPDGAVLSGMAIKQGVTVITGGAYSGKSTLLTAMLSGIYDHVPGDGREYCITDRNCFKIIAEDGRRVLKLDITPFIRNAPGMNMSEFSTEHASGSTSQAANIMEAISFGCKLLLIDEDRTATNFMIRDARMKKLIQNDPIIPFTDRVRQLYREAAVSSVLIIGGSSEYLDIADHVYFMEDFQLLNFKEQVESYRIQPYEYFAVQDEKPIVWKQERSLKAGSLTTFTRKAESGKYKEDIHIDGTVIHLGDIQADVSRIESIVSEEQVNALLWICRYIALHCVNKPVKLLEEVRAVCDKIRRENFSFLVSSAFAVPDVMELPHIFDILAALSRMSGTEYIDSKGQGEIQ